MNFDLPMLPLREAKPRKKGITMVMDKGLSIGEAKNFAEANAHYTDFVKLGFGTSILTPGVKEKVAIYQNAGMPVYVGGTLFEAFIVRGLFDEYKKYIAALGVQAVEISDGSMEIEHGQKLTYIRELSKQYIVLSEIGNKQAGLDLPQEEWVSQMSTELEAGAFRVIAESRESGNVGIYDCDGNANASLIDEIIARVGMDNVIWEAPLKKQQVYFIKNIGSEVNLGNIAPNEVIALETLRLGLRGDTFFDFLPESLSTFKKK